MQWSKNETKRKPKLTNIKEIAALLRKIAFTPQKYIIKKKLSEEELLEKFYERLPSPDRIESPPVVITPVPLWAIKAITAAREKGYKGEGLPMYLEEEVEIE